MKIMSILLVLLSAPLSANALEAFVCEPEWGALLQELSAGEINVTVGSTAFQDPHRLQAKPSLISAIRRADLVVCSGADLEIGWLPLLLRRSGNPKIQPGNPGYFLAADYVRKLEVPRVVDRSQGDVHPQGNPHIQMNPHNIARVAAALTERLGKIDPAKRVQYEANHANFEKRWSAAIDEWEDRAYDFAGLRLASNHLSFSYLADWLDLNIVATLESKPGIPPSAAQLAKVLEQLSADPPKAIIHTPYENKKPSDWLSKRLGPPAIQLPYTVGGAEDAIDLFSLFDVTVRMLEEISQ